MLLRSYKTIISGTATDLRISAVDLAAFIDNDATIPLYADGRSIIRIYDSSNRYLEGVLGNVGTGETLGDELVTNGNFSAWSGVLPNETPTGWTVGNRNVSNYVTQNPAGQCQLIAPDYAVIISQAIVVAGQLYKYGLDIKTVAAMGLNIAVGGGAVVPLTTTGVKSGYRTGGTTNTNYSIYRYNNPADVTFDDASLLKVLTPSTSGCTILNAAGAQSFISKDANFTYNAESYTYKIFTNKRIVNPRSFMGVSTHHI